MRIVLLVILFLQIELFSFTYRDFQQVYHKIEQRLHPTFTLLIIANKDKVLYIGGSKKEQFVHNL